MEPLPFRLVSRPRISTGALDFISAPGHPTPPPPAPALPTAPYPTPPQHTPLGQSGGGRAPPSGGQGLRDRPLHKGRRSRAMQPPHHLAFPRGQDSNTQQPPARSLQEVPKLQRSSRGPHWSPAWCSRVGRVARRFRLFVTLICVKLSRACPVREERHDKCVCVRAWERRKVT